VASPVTQSSGRAPPVHLLMYTGRNTLTGVMNAESIAMCCLGTPRSNSFSVVRVSAALQGLTLVHFSAQLKPCLTK